MGFFPKLFAGDPAYLADPTGRRWYEMIQKGGSDAVDVALEVIDSFSKGTFPPALASMPGSKAYRSAWGARGPDGDPGARLHVADLVRALRPSSQRLYHGTKADLKD